MHQLVDDVLLQIFLPGVGGVEQQNRLAVGAVEFGEDKELSFGRCAGMKSFNELFDGLNNLE